jgi:hypothetical protein
MYTMSRALAPVVAVPPNGDGMYAVGHLPHARSEWWQEQAHSHYHIWTPTPVPTVATATPTPTPTEEPLPAAPAGIAIGRYVRVAGTGGYGLNLRAGPGEDYMRMDIALEGEEFLVVDGPVAAGEFVWWKIRDRENSEREWWAAGNFLEPIENP